MATPEISLVIGSEYLSNFTIIFLLILISAAEIIDNGPDSNKRFAAFIKTRDAIIIPLTSIFVLYIITNVIMIL